MMVFAFVAVYTLVNVYLATVSERVCRGLVPLLIADVFFVIAVMILWVIGIMETHGYAWLRIVMCPPLILTTLVTGFGGIEHMFLTWWGDEF